MSNNTLIKSRGVKNVKKKKEVIFDSLLIAVGFLLLIFSCIRYGLKIDD
ncbi:MAG: hypothetical protein ACFWT2_02725 [Thermoanaerobacterium thermosaccharolyticum]